MAALTSQHPTGELAAVACTCCQRRFTGDEWRELHLVGYFDDAAGVRHEQRNCPCTATLNVAAPRALDELEALLEGLGAYLRNGRMVRRELRLRADEDGRIVLEASDYSGRIRSVRQHDLATALERAIVTSYVVHTTAESATG